MAQGIRRKHLQRIQKIYTISGCPQSYLTLMVRWVSSWCDHHRHRGDATSLRQPKRNRWEHVPDPRSVYRIPPDRKRNPGVEMCLKRRDAAR